MSTTACVDLDLKTVLTLHIMTGNETKVVRLAGGSRGAKHGIILPCKDIICFGSVKKQPIKHR